ncbi:MAG: hypothetical protein ACXWG4_11810 [Thermoanaerobaculia bacterium]
MTNLDATALPGAVPRGSDAGTNAALPLSNDAQRREAFGNESNPKPEPGGIESIPVEIFLIIELRRLQFEVNKFIRGYIEFEELRSQCRKARNFAGKSPTFGELPALREEAWEQVSDAFGRIPPGLDDLVEPIGAEVDKLRDLINGEGSPIYVGSDMTDEDVRKFYGRVSFLLSTAENAVGVALGICIGRGLEALDSLNSYVESIFLRTDEARRAVSNRNPFRPRSDSATLVAPEVDAFASASRVDKPAPGEFGSQNR